MLDIKITRTTCPKEKPQDESKLGFGKKFTDHMFVMDYTEGEGWHDARIVPLRTPSSWTPLRSCSTYRTGDLRGHEGLPHCG